MLDATILTGNESCYNCIHNVNDACGLKWKCIHLHYWKELPRQDKQLIINKPYTYDEYKLINKIVELINVINTSDNKNIDAHYDNIDQVGSLINDLAEKMDIPVTSVIELIETHIKKNSNENSYEDT